MATNYQTGFVMPSGKPNPYQQQQKPPSPWGAIDPSQKLTGQYSGTVDQAWQGLNYAAQTGWGRQLSPEEQQKIAQHAQQNGYAGGNVNQDQYNTALGYMEQLLGAKPSQGEQGPKQELPQLGNENAQNQWQQQARVTGVPQSFRGSNPYAQQQQQIMQRILANPQTMGQQQQDQLNESQKESAVRLQRQAQQQGQQQLAGRGFGAGGGSQQQLNAQTNQQMMNQVLAGRRDVALKAAQQNRQDELQALQQSGQMAQQDFSNDMQLGQLGLNQINQNRQGNLQDFLGLHGADMDVMRLQEGQNQFNKTFGLDFLRYLQNGDQFNQSMGENKRQFNNQMGYNWSNLQGQQMDNFLARLLGVY